MQPIRLGFLLGVLVLGMGALELRGVDVPATPASAGEGSSQFLGERFTSLAGGISFRAPAGGKASKPARVGTAIVDFVSVEDRWTLKVSRMLFDKPSKLVMRDNPATSKVDESQMGVIAQFVRQIQAQNQGTAVLRQDIVNVGVFDTGLIVSRYTQGQAWLRQYAIIEASERLYYVLEYTTPSGRTPTDKADDEDQAEALAVRIFREMLDTVQILDQRPIIEHNNNRLLQTQLLLVNLPKQIKKAMAAEQYYLIKRKGKDIGWSFVAEEPGERQGQQGFFVASLTYAAGDDGVKTTVASEAFCADNRKSEAWVNVTVMEKDGKKASASEFGQSEKRVKRTLDEKKGVVDPLDPAGPRIRVAEQNSLSVTQTTKGGTTSVTRELAPFYLPQCISQMLPRLVPTDKGTGYLFAVWVGGEQEVCYRYIDVDPERKVKFGGREVDAIIIKDRIGLEGEATCHYLSPDGNYLGNENTATGVSMIATTQKAISAVYPDATIARPHVLDTTTDR